MAKEQETRNPNRHSQWLPQAAFSTLCLVSIINAMVGDLKDQTKELKWSVSALSISLGFSGFAIFANYLLLNGKFQGTRVEGVMVSEIIVRKPTRSLCDSSSTVCYMATVLTALTIMLQMFVCLTIRRL
jgi:hypothetical protein